MSGCVEALVSKSIKFPGLFRSFGKERYNCIMELDNCIRTNIKTLKTYNFILEIIYFENNSLTLHAKQYSQLWKKQNYQPS